MTLSRLALVLAVLGIPAASGCAAADGTSAATGVDSRKDGLTVLEADEAAGKLVAVFRKDGREVSFDLRLGGKMENPPEDPGLSSYEIDARILDGAGQTMYLQAGGDALLDPTWRMPVLKNIDAVGRLKDFQLALEAESAFASLTVPTALEQLRMGARELAHGLTNIADKPGALKAVPTEPTTGDGALAPKASVFYAGTSAADYWDYQVWRKSTAVIAEHSAVRIRAWTSSKSFLFGGASCNHGTCTNVSPMAVKCAYSGWLADDGTNSRYFYDEPSGDMGIVSGGCSTPYFATGYSGRHNCNDDSRLQIKAIETDSSQSRTAGTCGDLSGNGFAPACN